MHGELWCALGLGKIIFFRLIVFFFMKSILFRFSKAANRSFAVFLSAHIENKVWLMWFFSLVFSTRYHPYLPCAMLQQKACHSFSTEKLLMRTKNKAIHMMCNAQVKCYRNSINLWKHFISRIRCHDFRNEWMNGGWRDTLLYLLHTY